MKLAGGISAALLWILFSITLVVRLIAGDGGLLAAEMLRTAPPEATGLQEKEYPGIGNMTAEFLTGKREVFQYAATMDTGGKSCARYEIFREHEAAHMADCRALIRLDTIVCACCGAAAALLTAAGLTRRAGRKAFLRGALWGLRIAACAAAGMLAWALADYDGLFVTFHHAAFPQGGWVLDPRTDVLIRLMPESFFIRLGIRGLLAALVIPAAVWIAARIGLKRLKGKE